MMQMTPHKPLGSSRNSAVTTQAANSAWKGWDESG